MSSSTNVELDTDMVAFKKSTCWNIIKDMIVGLFAIVIGSVVVSYLVLSYYLGSKISISLIEPNTTITYQPGYIPIQNNEIKHVNTIGNIENSNGKNIKILQLHAYTPYDSGLDMNGEIIMPPIKSLCIQVANEFNKTLIKPVSDEEIRKGLINVDRVISHLFYGMNIYLELHNRTCTAMHHFTGYTGAPRTLVSIYLGGSRYINMINPMISIQSKTILETTMKSSICKNGYVVKGPDYIMVDFKTTKNLLNVKKERLEDPSNDEPFTIASKLEGEAALCLHMILQEMKQGNLCK